MYAGLSGLINQTIAYGPGNRVGVTDQWGRFYYFRDLNNEARYASSVGKQIPNISEDYLSLTDPTVAVPGQLPWGLPGSVPATTTTVVQQGDSGHKVPWYHQGKYYLYGAGALLGLSLLGSDAFQNALTQPTQPQRGTTYYNPGQYNAVMNWNAGNPSTWLTNPANNTPSAYNPNTDFVFRGGSMQPVNPPAYFGTNFGGLHGLSGWSDENDYPNFLSGIMVNTAKGLGEAAPAKSQLEHLWAEHKTAVEITMIIISMLSLWRFLSSKK